MCGIFGFTGESDVDLLRRMGAVLSHRGPDDEGFYKDDLVSLGNRRLSIIGLSMGRQPLYDESGDVVLVYNGEIYNYLLLREELERRGHRFATDSDGEVICHLYQEMGEALVGRLTGMFAFALWDRSRGRLVLARDRLGIKPLFWTELGGRFLFASEVKAFFQAPGFVREVDAGALDALITLRYVPGVRTLFRGVSSFPPGYVGVWTAGGGLDLRRYWEVSVKGTRRESASALVDEFCELFSGAVESHLMSEVPLGATLSGGLDSSLVVALMSRIVDRPVKTYSIGFGGPGDERVFARMVADHCHTDHTEFSESVESFTEHLPRLLWHIEEPTSGALLPTLFLAARAAEHVKVMLVGEGADEIFGGYIRFKTAAGPFGWLPGPMGRWAYLKGVNAITAGEKRRLMTPGGPGREENGRLLNGHLNGAFLRYGSRRRQDLLCYEQREQLPNYHLSRVDRLTMAYSVEARVPYMDHQVVEFANSLPARLKLRRFTEKYLLRQAALRYLPREIVFRKKQGMSTPVEAWYGKGLRELGAEVLSESALRRRGYFQSRYVKRLFDRAGGRHVLVNETDKLNLLMMIEYWHRLFIDPVRFEPRDERGVLYSPMYGAAGG